MRYHLRRRQFLNQIGHHSGAHILAIVADSTSCDLSPCTHSLFSECHDLILELSDCNRVIRLAFDVETAAERRNSRRKLEVLIDTLEEFRAAFEIEAERAAGASRRRTPNT